MDVAARARAESLFRSRRRRARLRAAPDRSRAADDVVGEVFVVAARRAGDVPADALPWLLAYTRRLIANRRRSSTRRAGAAGPGADAATAGSGRAGGQHRAAHARPCATERERP